MNRSDPPPAPEKRPATAGGMVVRILVPCAILALGWIGFAALAVGPGNEKDPPRKKRAIKTRVAELEEKDFQTVITAQGVVRPHNEVPLSAMVEGEIIRIHPEFEDGAFFNEGDVLVELDPSDFEAAVVLAEAEKVRAEVAYAQEVERVEMAKINWRKLGNGDSPRELALRLPQLKEAEVQVNATKAQWEKAKRDLERTQIRAPYVGRVRQRTVGLGQTITTTTPLGIIFAIDYAEVRLPLAGRDLAFLDLPEDADDLHVPVEFTDALNADNPAVWTGHIVRTEGVLDPGSLELFAIARVTDPFGRESGAPPLRIGQPVTGRIGGKVLENVIALPRNAVYRFDQIYLIDKKDLTLASHTITPLWTTEEHVVVRDPEINPARQALSLSRLVYAPEGATVEIVPGIDETVDPALSHKPAAKPSSDDENS